MGKYRQRILGNDENILIKNSQWFSKIFITRIVNQRPMGGEIAEINTLHIIL